MNKFFLVVSLLFSLNANSKVKVKYLNQRFMWIEAPSKNVKVHLDKPIEGLALYSIDIKTSKEEFRFVLRRAWPYKNCVDDVVRLRRFLKKNRVVEIIGYPGVRDNKGSYSSLWEIIRSSSGCIGYFGDCENYEKIHPEWNDWKSRPIDPKIYP
jgi:hypothetical protein